MHGATENDWTNERRETVHRQPVIMTIIIITIMMALVKGNIE